MPFRAVCRLCLATNAFNYCLIDTPLQAVYEKLTNQPLNTPNMPVVACYLCAAQLRKCHNVMVRSVKANEILTRILKTMNKHKSMVIDLKACNLTEVLTMSAINHTDILDVDPNVKIKDEPQYHGNERIQEFSGNRITNKNIAGVSGNDLKVEIKQEVEEYSVEIEEYTHSGDILDVDPNVKIKDEPQYHGYERIQEFSGNRITNKNIAGVSGNDMKVEIKQEVEEYTHSGAASPMELQQYTFVPTLLAPTQRKNVQEYENKKTTSEEDISSVSVFSYLVPKTQKQKTIANEKDNCVCKITCSICKQWFRKKERFNIHLRTHSGKVPYTCATCYRRFNFREELNNHLRLHTTEVHIDKYFKCASCKAKFLHRNKLNEHIREHSSTLSALKPFLKVHNTKKYFKCGSCAKKFIKRNLLIEHLRTHSVVKPFHCTKCTNKFVSEDRLQNHMKIHEPKAFVCTVCGQRFDGDRYLFRHFHKQHPDKKSVVFVQR